jgi:DNA-binding NarL/FixJ family response regulator
MSIDAEPPSPSPSPSSLPRGQRIPKKEHISWRRERVAELSAQGRTERQIATILKVSLGTVSSDITYLNKKAREGLEFHIQEHLPKQYQKVRMD